MSEAEVRLFELLDKVTAVGPGVVSISSLQEACVQVPYLSLKLTGRRRYQLYYSLLLDKSPTDVPETFRQHERKEEDAHKTVMARLKDVFHGDELIDDAELQGFLCYFSFTTGRCFDDEMTAITLALATMIVDAELPPGVERLRQLCQLLGELCKDFVVHTASRAFDASLVPLLRLLLQYHDPHLSRHFDHHLLEIGTFLLNWVRRLFVVGNNFQEALYIWDWLLCVGDPTMTVYFALAYLIAHRQRFLTMQTREEMTEALESIVFLLPTCKEDAIDPAIQDGRPVSFLSLRSGKSLAQNADIAYRNTPRVTQRVIDSLLFPNEGGISRSPEALAKYYGSYTALPLERSDFGESFAVKAVKKTDLALLSYVIIDCRARQSFEFASLPTAIHVGDDVDFDNDKLEKLALRLVNTKGAHLCVFGTGRPITEEFNLLKMISLHLVQCGFPYVSIGGFRTLLPLVKAQAITIVGISKASVMGSGVSNSMVALKNGLAELFPHIELDKQEARRKAEDLGNKAKSGVMAAKSWGWGMMQRMGERLVSGSAPPQRGELIADEKKTSSRSGNGDDGSEAKGDDDPQRGFLSHLTREGLAQRAFSLGVDENDDDDEDFDLIKSVPVYTATPVAHHGNESLLKGMVVDKSSSSSLPPANNSTVAIRSPLEASARSEDIVAEIDGEFERLFGDSTSACAPSFGVVLPQTEEKK